MPSAPPAPALLLDVIVLSDGTPSAARETVASAVPFARRIRLLERSSSLTKVPGAEVVACDWHDDLAAAAVTGSGEVPLLIAGAGEVVRVLDPAQLAGLLSMGTDLSHEIWTGAGWEVRLRTPGPGAGEHIGGSSDRRAFAVEIVPGDTSDHGWREPSRTPAATATTAGHALRFGIVTPGYNERSGGIVALHALCHRLNSLGHHAVLLSASRDFAVRPGWKTPVDNDPALDDMVIVYPEIIQGNPLDAPRVVRWLLNRPGYVSGAPMKEREGDLLVAYTEAIDPTLFTLTLPITDPGVFFPKDVPGRTTLVWVGKGTPRAIEGVDLAAATEITRAWPGDRRALAALLRGADVLYSFDSLSAVNLEATLCGTPVMLFPDERWDRAEVERNGTGVAGLGWYGQDDLEQVRQAATTAYDRHLEAMALADATVDGFARLCAEFFAGRKAATLSRR